MWVTIQYECGQSQSVEYIHEPGEFCPQCGAKSAWHENDFGDYYLGERIVCTTCASSWTMQGPRPADQYRRQVIAQLLEVE